VDNIKNKPYEERLTYFQQKFGELMKETDIEAIPTLHPGISAIVAQITLIDIQNPEMLKKYGLKKREPVDSTQKSSNNPLVN